MLCTECAELVPAILKHRIYEDSSARVARLPHKLCTYEYYVPIIHSAHIMSL